MLQPVVQTPEVHLLLFVVRLARAEDIKTAGPGLYAGQFVQIPEAETEDEITLVGTDVSGQDDFAGVIIVDTSQPGSGAFGRCCLLVNGQSEEHTSELQSRL